MAAGTSRDEVFRRFDVRKATRPAYVVWELTLACDQHCTHCGSRAGEAREGELTTEQALGVVTQLQQAGTFEVVLIGGEAYLHPGFLEIVRALKAAGIRPSMTTGGRGLTPELVKQLARAGMHTVSLSIDGLRETHDLFRASPAGPVHLIGREAGHQKALQVFDAPGCLPKPAGEAFVLSAGLAPHQHHAKSLERRQILCGWP